LSAVLKNDTAVEQKQISTEQQINHMLNAIELNQISQNKSSFSMDKSSMRICLLPKLLNKLIYPSLLLIIILMNRY